MPRYAVPYRAGLFFAFRYEVGYALAIRFRKVLVAVRVVIPRIAIANTKKEEIMNQALVLIDIQNDYFPDGAMELVDSLPALANARRLLEHFRKKGRPVYHIQHLSTRPDATFFIPDTPGADIHQDLKPLQDETVVTKNRPNGFFQTNLLELLRNAGITDLAVAGMMTHMCIDTTVRAARDLGFATTLYGDACATRDLTFDRTTVRARDVQVAYLAALSGMFATVAKTDSLG